MEQVIYCYGCSVCYCTITQYLQWYAVRIYIWWSYWFNKIDYEIIEKNPSILPLSVCHVFDCDTGMMSLYTLHIDDIGNKVWVDGSTPLTEVR